VAVAIDALAARLSGRATKCSALRLRLAFRCIFDNKVERAEILQYLIDDVFGLSRGFHLLLVTPCAMEPSNLLNLLDSVLAS
jgi:hypothetical protein